MSTFHRLFALTIASGLLGCHPQAAGPAGPAQLRPLEQELIETAVRARIGDLSPCLMDADVVPGQEGRKQMATLQISITDQGRVQNVTVQKVDDLDLNECITRKSKEWAFPRGGTTVIEVTLRFAAKSAELANLRIQPVTRSADSSR